MFNYSRFHLLAFILGTRWIYLLMDRKNWKMKETVCKSGTFGFCTLFCRWRKYRLDRSHQEPWLYCAHDSDLNLRYTSFPSDTVFERRPTSWRREIDSWEQLFEFWLRETLVLWSPRLRNFSDLVCFCTASLFVWPTVWVSSNLCELLIRRSSI